MVPNLSWYVDLIFDVDSLADMVAVPQIIAMNAREWLAGQVIDRTGKFGRALASVVMQRYHLARAKELKSDCYCLYHACDLKNCPAP